MKSLESYSRILITGGTGSFGRRFVKKLLHENLFSGPILIFSRDEYKQYRMRQYFPAERFPQLRFVLGDVRDRDKLMEVFAEGDLLIHAAALKQVDTAEANPMEFIKTNVLGSENVIRAALAQKVRKVIALSTDKAVNPVSLYGGSKLCADKLFLAATEAQPVRHTIFSVVRYGNVLGSRGSVVPLFLEKAQLGEQLPLTHPQMTRFSVPVGVESALLLRAIAEGQGGEVFVPKVPSYRITDLARAIAPDLPTKVIGLRPGEKLHEELISAEDRARTQEFAHHFVVYPPAVCKEMISSPPTLTLPLAYVSSQNTHWLSPEQLQAQVQAYTEAEPIF
ncbi:MAG: UDP-N-acetylglucosamine 4,6-dehydratase (inverting) [Microscillaceae bacterium]